MSGKEHAVRAAAHSSQLDVAHRQAVAAAVAGLQDPALAEIRLTGPGVGSLADAAVSSATPFLRAPLLAKMSAVAALHPAAGNADGFCGTCRIPAPCPTAEALQW
jgi:hypothetical protein